MGNSQSTSKLKPRVILEEGQGTLGPGVETGLCDPADDYWEKLRPLPTTFVLGSAMEWIGVFAYPYFTAELKANFFPGSDLATWIGFAALYIPRPLGGFLLGMIGDTFGRRPQALVTMGSHMTATFVTGILPSYLWGGERWGLFGRNVLIACRVVQGISIGGEISVSTSYVAESAPPSVMGSHLCVLDAGINGAGMVLSIMVLSLHSFLTPHQLAMWGWRIPYLITTLPSIVALWYRVQMDESEEFISNKEEKEGKLTQWEAAKQSLPQTVVALSVYANQNAAAYVLKVYIMSTLMEADGGANASRVLAMVLIQQTLNLLQTPVSGFFQDTVGEGNMVFAGSCLTAAVAVPMWMISQGRFTWTVAFFAFVAGNNAVCFFLEVPHHLFCSQLFPTSTRAASLGLLQNTGACVFGGMAPVYIQAVGPSHPNFPGFYVAATGLLSGLAQFLAHRSASKGKLNLTHLRYEPY